MTNQMTEQELEKWNEMRGYTATKQMMVDMKLEDKTYKYLVDNGLRARDDWSKSGLWIDQIVFCAYCMAIDNFLARRYDEEYKYNTDDN